MLKALLVVVDSFLISGRGQVLAPALELDQGPEKGAHRFRAHLPDGRTLDLEGRIEIEHLKKEGGESHWDKVVLLDPESPRLPAGTELWLFDR
jgi:hypothetical protein